MNKNFEWQGRNDPEDGKHAKRWHHVAREGRNADLALLGFPCDIGVERNKGRVGAALAPNALREALCNLAWHSDKTFTDNGDVSIYGPEGDALEVAQDNLALNVKSALHQQGKVIVLGGGHETAAGSFKGLHQYLHGQSKRIGVLNLDAHFDIRLPGENGISSGTPFTQIRDILKVEGQELHYMVLGVSKTGNTQALFERADSWNVRYKTDRDVSSFNKANIAKAIDDFLAQIDVLYLTLDLDVLPHWQMPAVSAPSGFGVDIGMIEMIIEHLGRSSTSWLLSDIVEFNPSLDHDGNAARTAARLIDTITRSMLK